MELIAVAIFGIILLALTARQKHKIRRYFRRRYHTHAADKVATTLFQPIGAGIIVVLLFALLWPILAALSIFIFPALAIAGLFYFIVWLAKEDRT